MLTQPIDAADCDEQPMLRHPPVAPQLRISCHTLRTRVPMATMAEINADKLINAVKKRPALYNKNDLMYYSHKRHKSTLWTEVAREVYPDWDTFRPQDKVECGHELQRRWKSLRTCFTREIAIQKKEKQKRDNNESVKRRKRYEYYDAMSFLLDPSVVGDNDTAADDDDDSSDPLDNVKNEYYEATAPEQNTSRYPIEVEAMPLQNTFERNESSDDRILEMLKEIKRDEEDEDRQFMLSLVPSFRKLKDKQKFEARIEILRVLKDITFKDD